MKKMNHTTASGVYPYDHQYGGIGYQVGHEGWSPFPRVNRLREKWGELPWNIDVTRLRLVTESYKEHWGESWKMQTAHAFEHLTANIPLVIYPDELIVGEIAAPAKEAPLFPEYSVKWIIDEIKNHPFEERPNDEFYIKSDEDRQEILELCEWWIGKTVNALVEESYTEEMKKSNECGASIGISSDYRFGGIGHTAVNYGRALKLGFDGLIEKGENARAHLHPGAPDYEEKMEQYEAMLITLRAAKAYTKRFAETAAEYAAKETDPQRKSELEQMSANLEQIAGGPAKTYWQALQLFNLLTTLIEMEANGQSISYGRFDQWLDPYLQHDLKQGMITKEFALELLEVQFVKLNNPTKLKDADTVAERNGRGFGGESLTIGGIGPDGEDATNDTTMMVLEASAHTRMLAPWTAVRFSDKTPYELLIKTVEVIRCGFGHPKLYNDAPAIKAYLEKGATLEEARNYSVVGCVEPTLDGREYGWVGAGMINAVKVMEMALNHGRLFGESEQIGPDAGGYDTFESFEEVLGAVDKEFEYATRMICECNNVLDVSHRKRKPLPFISTLFNDPLDNGLDLTEGGAQYNGTGPETSGCATAADILSTIKQLVFDEKSYSIEELVQACLDNWEGHEKLYQLVNSSKVHHFGNDDDYADDLFKFVFNSICTNMKKNKNHPRGGKFNPGVYSVNANVSMGHQTVASIDGRKNGEPISENMCPVHTECASHDVKGPTAIINSVAKVDHGFATNGTLLNIRFPEDAVAGTEGRDNLAGFISELIDRKILHVQFNVMSAEKMKAAQKNPQDYKDMLVRVAGYSAYFVELGRRLQNDIIGRTEYHF